MKTSFLNIVCSCIHSVNIYYLLTLIQACEIVTKIKSLFV